MWFSWNLYVEGNAKVTIWSILFILSWNNLSAFYLHRRRLAPTNNMGWQIGLNLIECLIWKLTYGIPKRLNSSIPMIDICISLQREKLSPSQWPVYFPLPTNVERLKTNARFPVAFWEALWENKRNIFFSSVLKGYSPQPTKKPTQKTNTWS